MKFNEIEQALPALVGANGARVMGVTKEEIATAGIPFTGAGMGKGDVVEFLEEYTFQNDVQKVEVRANSDRWDYRLAVVKNGKPDWVSLGFFCRVDKDRLPVHPVSEELNKLHDHGGRIEGLVGRKVKADKTVEFERQAFTADGTRQDGVFEKRSTAYCEFAQ